MLTNSANPSLRKDGAGVVGKRPARLTHKFRDFGKVKGRMCEDGRIFWYRHLLSRNQKFGFKTICEIYLQLRDHVDNCNKCYLAQSKQYKETIRKRQKPN